MEHSCADWLCVAVVQDFLLKEFEHPIDYDLHAALPRLQTWGLVKKNHQVGALLLQHTVSWNCWRVLSSHAQKHKPTPYTPHSS